MKTVRHQIFETNSSSTHAIALNKRRKINQTITPNSDDGREIIIYQYAELNTWKFQVIRDSYTKLVYLVTAFISDSAKLKTILHTVKEFTGYPVKIPIPHKEEQSKYPGYFTFKLTKANIINFLFSKGSLIITGNDNNSCVNQATLIAYQKETAKYKLTILGEDIWLVSNEYIANTKNTAQVDIHKAICYILGKNNDFDNKCLCQFEDVLYKIEDEWVTWDIQTPLPEGEGVIHCSKYICGSGNSGEIFKLPYILKAL